MKRVSGYIPQLSSSSALGQSSNPSQTELFGMQEPSPQVKSMEGQGAKPTGGRKQKSLFFSRDISTPRFAFSRNSRRKTPTPLCHRDRTVVVSSMTRRKKRQKRKKKKEKTNDRVVEMSCQWRKNNYRTNGSLRIHAYVRIIRFLRATKSLRKDTFKAILAATRHISKPI